MKCSQCGMDWLRGHTSSMKDACRARRMEAIRQRAAGATRGFVAHARTDVPWLLSEIARLNYKINLDAEFKLAM